MLEFPRLKIILRVKLVLLIGMAVLALLNLYQVARVTATNLEKLEQWPRQSATIVSLAFETEIEIEVASAFADALPRKHIPEYCFSHEPDRSCLLLPRQPYAWYSLFDDVEILQNPQQLEELEVLSMTGLWLPVLGHVVVVLLLAVGWKWFSGSGLGEDRTWSNGGWIPSESAPQRIGLSALDAESIRESAASRNGVIFWSVMCLVIAGIAVPGLMIDMATNPLEALIIMVVVLCVLLLVLYSALQAYSRVIYQDKTGLIDANLFGVKRVPWAAVGGIDLINLNKEAQASFSRRFGAGRRPQNLNVYIVSDKQGHQILRLSQQMIPSDAFSALLKRLRDLTEKRHRPTETESASLRAEWNNMASLMAGKPKSLFHREHRGLLIALMVMLLPFVLGTVYLCYQSLWFMYGAERAQGQVVEIKNDGLPSLVIEYRSTDGEVLLIESDGSESYGAFQVGDTLTVYYEGDNPENARLDLFLELWLGPIIMGIITGIVIVLVVLIARGMTAPMPGM